MDFSYNKRALLRYFERMDIDVRDRGSFVARSFANDRERQEAWLRDSLLWGIEELEAGNLRFAYRGLIQASEYAEAVGHDSITFDAMAALKWGCENAIEQVDVNRRQLEEVLADAREQQGLDVFLFQSDSGSGIVRAQNVDVAVSLVREHLEFMNHERFVFRLFRPTRVDGVIVTTIGRPVHSGY